MTQESLIKALMVTAEIYGKAFSEPAAVMFVEDLAGYPEPALLKALSLCRRELRFFPTVADILARVDDGRPGVDEAWALLPKSEADSVVWTDEMAGAYAVSRLLEDQVAARHAFREKYQALLAQARRDRHPARWTPSLGLDREGQEAALREAVDRGRLSAPQAAALLPNGIAEPGKGLLMIGTDIPDDGVDAVERARALARQLLKNAPIERQAVEALHQRQDSTQTQQEHEERVKAQLALMKNGGI